MQMKILESSSSVIFSGVTTLCVVASFKYKTGQSPMYKNFHISVYVTAKVSHDRP